MTAPTPSYLNRELSWLEFNQRVLEEACDEIVPLLERVKYLAITASNLDEFFRVRVGGLQVLAEQASARPEPSGLTPAQQLAAIGQRVRKMVADQYDCFLNRLAPQLAQAGIRWIKGDQLTAAQQKAIRRIFDSEIHPVLSPLAVTADNAFPLLAHPGLNMCVRLKPATGADGDAPRFAVLPLVPSTNRIIHLPSENERGVQFLLLEDVVAMFVDQFFAGETVVECVPFRITRNADMSVREDVASDLLAEMENVINERKTADCVRLELVSHASKTVTQFLSTALQLSRDDLYPLAGPLDLSAFMKLAERRGFDELKFEPWTPQHSPRLLSPDDSLFSVIAERDLLLYHPYESYEPVVRLIEEAANDPEVLAIKQTLYRTSRDSRIVAALLRAARNGKHVTAVVELKARFDEARNISWAKTLEHAGAHVIYGVKGLKTHAKICIIVRREPQGIVRYLHLGTGNYNEDTARFYSDASLLTCDPDLGSDASAFFNAITGFSQPQRFRKLEAAPLGLREVLLELIQHETERRKQGESAKIVAKLNSLVDPQLIDALYEASQAGVEVKLNIRGICCLRPGVPGLSDNIEVISIIDRFLEHARVLYFHHGGQPRVFLSSADWMPRNLDRRIEILVPVLEEQCQRRLTAILMTYFQDSVKARRLLADGSHARIVPSKKNRPPVRVQQRLHEEAVAAVAEATQRRRTTFEPHLAPSEKP